MRKTNLVKILDFKGQRFYIGLDIHKKSWSVTIRSLGLQLAYFTQPPNPEALVNYLNRNYPEGEYYSAYEAGFSGTSIHEKLCMLGVKNIIINPADIPSTDKQKKNKTDLHDSRTIAENLERGSLRGIYVLTRKQQELRSLFRLRQNKVSDVTRSNNRLKSFLIYFGIEIPETISKKEFLSLKALEWLSSLRLESDPGAIVLQQRIKELKYQREQLYQITKQLRERVQTTYAENYKWIISVPGIGPITAMALISEIADFSRFDDPDEYSSFLGLCPWESTSGDSIKTKGIQPRCNKYVRHLLIEASWMAIRKSPTFLHYYSKHAVKNSKKAIIKVARKLALTAKGVVKNKGLYQENYLLEKKNRFSLGIAEQHINI